jgi:hypothetical protein
MPRKLLDTVQEMEAKEAKQAAEKKDKEKGENKKPIENIISREGLKNKQISAKVNMKMFNAFTKINRMQGLSNNSALNMIITKYVRENKSLLDEDDFI